MIWKAEPLLGETAIFAVSKSLISLKLSEAKTSYLIHYGLQDVPTSVQLASLLTALFEEKVNLTATLGLIGDFHLPIEASVRNK